MARFPRPYCATEPVRTVPFFNLYDDIQITQLGAFTDDSTELDKRYSMHQDCAGQRSTADDVVPGARV